MRDHPALTIIPARLATDAESLAKGRRLPLNLFELLADLGLGLTLESANAAARGGGLRRTAEGWEVFVVSNARADSLAPRDRFTIAHEVGHYLISARFGFRPRSRSEYWRLEGICHAFARALLAPADAVREIVSRDPESSAELIAKTRLLSVRTGLSIEPSSRRLLDFVSRPSALQSIELDETPGDDSDSVGRLLWSVDNRSAGEHGRHKRIARKDPLAVALSAFSGTQARIELPNTDDACAQRRGRHYLVASLIRE